MSVDIGKRKGAHLDILQDVETSIAAGSVRVCDSPLCAVSFPDSGLKCKPKRFCSDECAQQASILRRAAELLRGVTDEQVLKILGRSPEHWKHRRKK
jgi:hypothetical protein